MSEPTIYDHLMVVFNDPNFMMLSTEARDALYAAQRANDKGVEMVKRGALKILEKELALARRRT